MKFGGIKLLCEKCSQLSGTNDFEFNDVTYDATCPLCGQVSDRRDLWVVLSE